MNNSGISSMNKYQVESINDKSNEYPDLDLAASEIFSGNGNADNSKYSACKLGETRLRDYA